MEKTASRMGDSITEEQKSEIDDFINNIRCDIFKFNLSLTKEPREFLISLTALIGTIQFYVLGTAISKILNKESQTEMFNAMSDLICETAKKMYQEDNQ